MMDAAVTLNEFSPQSKLWIYTANRLFSDSEIRDLNKYLAEFCIAWTAHNKALKATGFVSENRFIILVVDEDVHQASGCSIDKSVHFLQELEQQFSCTLFDRMLFTYIDSIGNPITLSRTDFEEAINMGAVNPKTIVFNNLLNNLGDWKKAWKIPLEETWMKSFFQLV